MSKVITMSSKWILKKFTLFKWNSLLKWILGSEIFTLSHLDSIIEQLDFSIKKMGAFKFWLLHILKFKMIQLGIERLSDLWFLQLNDLCITKCTDVHIFETIAISNAKINKCDHFHELEISWEIYSIKKLTEL